MLKIIKHINLFKFEQIDNFFQVNGRKIIMFYYQDNKSSDSQTAPGRTQATSTATKKKLFISNGVDEALDGAVYYFLRSSNNKTISVSNVSAEVNFGVIDASNGRLLEGVEKLLSSVMLPALSTLDDWGTLENRNHPHVQYFVDILEQFVTSLNGARSNMSNQIKLDSSDYDATLSSLQTLSDYQNASLNNEFVVNCENLLQKWCKQITKVLTESEQIRREADDTGPYCKYNRLND